MSSAFQRLAIQGLPLPLRVLWLSPLPLRRCDRCAHRSHRLRLPCLRYWRWDSFCAHHNNACWTDTDCLFVQRITLRRKQRLAPIGDDPKGDTQ